jgi:putative phosphoesterase
VIHAGDLISPFTAQEFRKLKSSFVAIFGNNDGERDGLRTAYQDLCYLEDFKELSVGRRKIAVIHGTNPVLVDALAHSGDYDVVIRAHTHQQNIIRQQEIARRKTLVINPGETCGYLSGHKTVVLLDPTDLSCQVVDI